VCGGVGGWVGGTAGRCFGFARPKARARPAAQKKEMHTHAHTPPGAAGLPPPGRRTRAGPGPWQERVWLVGCGVCVVGTRGELLVRNGALFFFTEKTTASLARTPSTPCVSRKFPCHPHPLSPHPLSAAAWQPAPPGQWVRSLAPSLRPPGPPVPCWPRALALPRASPLPCSCRCAWQPCSPSCLPGACLPLRHPPTPARSWVQPQPSARPRARAASVSKTRCSR